MSTHDIKKMRTKLKPWICTSCTHVTVNEKELLMNLLCHGQELCLTACCCSHPFTVLVEPSTMCMEEH